MGDSAAIGRLMARSAREPDADAHRTHLRHPIGEKTKAIIENVSDDTWVRQR
jgi:hypothetical protein